MLLTHKCEMGHLFLFDQWSQLNNCLPLANITELPVIFRGFKKYV